MKNSEVTAMLKYFMHTRKAAGFSFQQPSEHTVDMQQLYDMPRGQMEPILFYILLLT